MKKYISLMAKLGFGCRIEMTQPSKGASKGWYVAFDRNGFQFMEPAGWIYDSNKFQAIRRAALMAYRRDNPRLATV